MLRTDSNQQSYILFPWRIWAKNNSDSMVACFFFDTKIALCCKIGSIQSKKRADFKKCLVKRHLHYYFHHSDTLVNA